ncbi:MAG: TonB family protein [Terracidiphilus sp.]
MFEDSTFESTGRLRTRSRRWMIATFAFNAAILLALILIPLFYPEALSSRAISILMTAPPIPVDEPKPVVRTAQTAPIQTEMPNGELRVPAIIPRDLWIATRPEPPVSVGVMNFPEGNSPAGSSLFPGGGAHANVVTSPAGPNRIPSVLAEGLLIRKVIPRYPSIGVAIHLEGTVVLQATISKSGTIENLRVMSGPAVLQRAALDAVAQWRYRPYLLNGEPVEVETTVNVEFRLQ